MDPNILLKPMLVLLEHVTSSLQCYPQSSSEAEQAIQTVKILLKREGDPYLALLLDWSTQLKCRFSPSELLMIRKLPTNAPPHKKVRDPFSWTRWQSVVKKPSGAGSRHSITSGPDTGWKVSLKPTSSHQSPECWCNQSDRFEWNIRYHNKWRGQYPWLSMYWIASSQ